MTDSIKEVRRQRLAKRAEIAGLVAEQLGFGPLNALNVEQRQRLDNEVDEMIETYHGALNEALFDTQEEWNALDERLASTAVGRLLREFNDLEDHTIALEDIELTAKAATQGCSLEEYILRLVEGDPDEE